MRTDSDEVNHPTRPAPIITALFFVLLAGITAFAVLDILAQILRSITAASRQGLIMVVLAGLAMVVGYGFFPLGERALGVKFSPFVRWGVFPVVIGPPMLWYALVGVTYVRP